MTLTTVTVTMQVPLERIVNCIVGFVEGGYSPWASAFHPTTNPSATSDDPEDKGIWYSRESFWSKAGAATLKYDDPNEDEGTFGAVKTIALFELILGLNTMAAKAPSHFSDLINENDDAITHDVFMQMVVFGEIIYG